MLANMLEYYKLLKERNIDIIYNGPVWQNVIESIAATVKKRLELDALPLSSSQAVFSVFIEQMYNILMYSADTEIFEQSMKKIPKGMFILGSKGKRYFLQSANVMKNSGAEIMKERIDHLNTLDKEGLRKYYKEQIKSDNCNQQSKGAGLGLIEIAKRASSKIEYSFEPYKEGLVLFTMYITIG
ncbi:MAG: SiaB family protein kinase [Sporomusaceae bacterium]|jgi:hypothetical protein|nr:SiaB family protein kinase [Sporomusaceae bacterium]